MKNSLKLNDKISFIRVSFFLVGLLILALGINLIIISNLGNGPWDAVNVGLSYKLNITVGFAMNIVALIHIIIGGILNKEFPKLTSMITSIILGIFIDLWMILFRNIVLTTLLSRTLIFLFAVLIVSLGVSLYLVTKLPNTPLDYFMLSIKNTFNLSIMKAKIICEFLGFIIGLTLGGTIGFGTIILLLGIGPILQILQTPCTSLYIKLSNKNSQDTIYI